MSSSSSYNNALEKGEPTPELPQPWLFMDTKCCCSKLDPYVRSIFSNETVGSIVVALILAFALLGVIFASAGNMPVVIGASVSAAILGFILHGISSFEHNTLKTSIGTLQTTLQTTVATKTDISNLATKDEIGDLATKDEIGDLATKDEIGEVLRTILKEYKAPGEV